MEPNFWHERWKNNEIGFHEPSENPLLVKFIRQLNLTSGSHILLPLCGKTHDLSWLALQGFQATGVELSQKAAEAFFDEHELNYTSNNLESHVLYQAPGINLFVGDFFTFSTKLLDLVGSIDAIYDRAALVALPPAMRSRYTAHLIDITHCAPQLLICYEYDQSLMNGPPFSIGDMELNQHYSKDYELSLLDDNKFNNKFNGQTTAEKVWLLKPREEH